MVAGVGVNQNDPVTFLFQCFTSLNTGIIKLTGLADYDWTSANDEYTF